MKSDQFPDQVDPEDEAALLREGQDCEFYVSRHDFPFELIVSVAAQMRASADNEIEAVNDALALLDACKSVLAYGALMKRKWAAVIDSAVDVGTKSFGLHFTFSEGVKIITGRGRLDRAEESYRLFLKERAWGAMLLEDKKEPEENAVFEKVETDLTTAKEVGFNAAEIIAEHSNFAEYAAVSEKDRSERKRQLIAAAKGAATKQSGSDDR